MQAVKANGAEVGQVTGQEDWQAMSLEIVQHIEKAKQTDKEYNLVITIPHDIHFDKVFSPLNTWADDNKLLTLVN